MKTPKRALLELPSCRTMPRPGYWTSHHQLAQGSAKVRIRQSTPQQKGRTTALRVEGDPAMPATCLRKPKRQL